MHLHLIRHGQTDWNAIRRIQGQSESHLDATGEAQADALGQALAEVPFRHVYCSTSARTRETALRLFRGRDIDTTLRADLREMNLGVWETLMWADVERDHPEEVGRYRAFDEAYEVEGAERLSAMQRRGLAAIDDIVALERAAGAEGAEGAAHIAIVSHGFLLRAILAKMLGRPLTEFAGLPALPNCAHSIVRITAEGFEVETIAGKAPREGMWVALFG